MSGGAICRCPEAAKPLTDRRWEVVDHKCNHSAFNGGHRTASDYSAVTCAACGAFWRTKAAYADTLPGWSKP